MTNYEELAAEADKYFPFYNGYDPERKPPKEGQVILALTKANWVKVFEYKADSFDIDQIFRWWPTKLFMKDGKFFQDTPEMREKLKDQ